MVGNITFLMISAVFDPLPLTLDKLQFLVLITLLSIIITDIGGIGVACYGALGHVPPRLPTIYFFPLTLDLYRVCWQSLMSNRGPSSGFCVPQLLKLVHFSFIAAWIGRNSQETFVAWCCAKMSFWSLFTYINTGDTTTQHPISRLISWVRRTGWIWCLPEVGGLDSRVPDQQQPSSSTVSVPALCDTS